MNSIVYTGILTVLCTLSLQATPTNQELFEQKNIVVIGGTGYLGRSIASAVLEYNPHKVIIFSRDEVKHFDSLAHFNNSPKIQNVFGDIRDFQAIKNATRDAHIVFHVGALKRMDAIENNVVEAIKTNVLGSINVLDACNENKVDKLLFISTDKACLPINAYGATKFISEKLFTNYDKSLPTTCVVTRFGNILESTRSVIPIFAEKIKNGEEIPLTDERMTRFIIAHKEAVELIFDALRYAAGGEIFVKKLHSFRIKDLIETLKQHYGADNPVKVVGIRPGEKLHEVLINQFEMQRSILFRGYYVVQPSVPTNYPKTPLYVKEGVRVTTDCLEEYSSDLAVVPQQSLASLFKSFELLTRGIKI